MVIKKIRYFLVIAAMLMIGGIPAYAAEIWTGSEYYDNNQTAAWGITEDRIIKGVNPGRVFSIREIEQSSAYATTRRADIGKKIEEALYWYNRSRLVYVRLFKVEGGQRVSVLLSNPVYMLCVEFDSDFVMVDDGSWISNGECCKLNEKTEWIMVIFRKDNGELNEGSGIDNNITNDIISGSSYRYIFFEPFNYTLKLNNGSYMGSSEDIKIERLGIEQITLPQPVREGYNFAGWKCEAGKTYKDTLEKEYDDGLFGDKIFYAVWEEIEPEKIVLDREYVIFEQNSNEAVSLNSSITPSDALNKSVRYISSDKSVVTVDSTGTIRPGKSGIARITALTANGIAAHCTVYVMGFEITVPTYCTLNEAYEIDIRIFNNGKEGMTGRKRVILDADDTVELVRVGDELTKYCVISESKTAYSASFVQKNGNILADRMDTGRVYYRLSPLDNIKKTGDYEGNVTFTVRVI